MKISFLTPHLKLYGGIRRVIELSNNLTRRGFDITIFHSDGSDCGWLKVEAKISSLKDFLQKEHDVMVYFNQEEYEFAKKVGAQKKYFYCCNLYNKASLRLPQLLLYLIDRRAFLVKKALLDKEFEVIVNCTDSKAWLEENFALDSDVVFGGVNKEIFHPVTTARDSGLIKIITAGSPKYWKGLETVKKAVEIVRATKPSIVLETYHGKNIPQNKMAEVYGSADIFVDAQYFLGWNNPIAEAMTCRVPVVCGHVGQNKDIAIDGETALMVPVRNPEKYAEAIIRLIDDKKLAEKLVKNAYAKISEFTWEGATKKLINILEQQK